MRDSVVVVSIHILPSSRLHGGLIGAYHDQRDGEQHPVANLRVQIK
jgi:hypothetical protein